MYRQIQEMISETLNKQAATVDQPILIQIVLNFVQNFVPDFTAADIAWVCSMKTSKLGIMNMQSRLVMSAS